MTTIHQKIGSGAALCVAVFVLASAYAASATSVFDISYPIAELDNCASQDECRIYCDAPEHERACMSWAQNNGFAPKLEDHSGRSSEDLLRDEEALANAPGGCTTSRECDAYCRVEEHMNECLDYSVTYGYATQEEADAIRRQAEKGGPGDCKSEEACNAYCGTSEHMQECLDFVVQEGKITQEEADFMIEQAEKFGGPQGEMRGSQPEEHGVDEEKVQAILEEKAGPGGCTTMETCAAYCEESEHMSECIAFAEENGIMDTDDIEMAKKMLTEGGPGGCKNEEECEVFCSQQDNRTTCFEFARDNGLVSEEDAAMMEKQMEIMQKLERPAGPGGCRSQEECDTYCSDDAHLEECMSFAGTQSGGVSGEQVRSMMGQTQEAQDKIRQLEEYHRQQEEGGGGGYDGQFMPSSTGPMGNFFGPSEPTPDGTYMMPPEGYDGQMPPQEWSQYMMPAEIGGEQDVVEAEADTADVHGDIQTDAQTSPQSPDEPTSMQALRMLGAAIAPFIEFFSFGL